MGAFDIDVCVVGGAGHVGFPLAVALASRGLKVAIHDINDEAVAAISDGVAPFLEPGVDEPLARALASDALVAANDMTLLERAEVVIVVVGTPVDQYLSPDPEAVPRAVGELVDHLRPGQLLVLRSTVFPGVTRRVEQLLGTHDGVDLAFCPERIAEGRAMTELFELPQIVSARTPRATKRAADLFRHLTDSIVELEPEEAELAKLFTNSWRYIKFAAANQYFMMANDLGLDFSRIRAAMMEGYPRAADLPGAGLAAGPCLFKDTMQLASVTGGSFPLGHSAMLVNEGLPDYLAKRIEAASRPLVDDGRHPRDGVQGRERRPAVEPVLPAQARAEVPRRARAHDRPVRPRRSRAPPARRGPRRGGPGGHRRAPRAVPRPPDRV